MKRKRDTTDQKRKKAVETYYEAVSEGNYNKTRIQQDLAGKYKVQTRTIQRWIKKYTPNKQDSLVSEREQLIKKHFNDIAEAATMLADNLDQLLVYKDKGIKPLGNIVEGLYLARSSPSEIPVKTMKNHIAQSVFRHYQNIYDTSFKRWQDVTSENVTQQLSDRLIKLAQEARLSIFEPCLDCSICDGIWTK
jgi:hypothetical protein